MQNFYNWMKQNKLAESTMQEHLANIKRFTAWAEGERHSDINHLRYQDILTYVQHEKSKSIEIATVNLRLSSIRKYYEYLKEEGITERNPVGRIRIKGAIKKVLKNQLTYTELETLYKEYINYTEQNPSNTIQQQRARQRNIVFLSLMISQGLHSGELARLKTTDIKLSKGTLYIPSDKKSNSRELKLEAHQILTLHTYLETIRPRQKPRADELFPGIVRAISAQLINELRGLNEKISSASQIRASVIMYWLKLYDKRQVQYMTGLKYLSSVEKYEQQDIETLTGQLKKYHPFG